MKDDLPQDKIRPVKKLFFSILKKKFKKKKQLQLYENFISFTK